MSDIIVPQNVDDLNVKDLTLRVIASSMNRREAMIAPAFKGDEVPDNPRDKRLYNELLSAQNSDALALLGINEQNNNETDVDAIRDIVAQAVRDVSDEIRVEAIPSVPDAVLGVDDARLIEEDVEVRLDEYLKDD